MITINLLPEDIRENIVYSKKNRTVLKYIRILVIVCVLLIASFGILYFFLSSSNGFFLKNIEESEAAIQKDQGILDDAKGLKSRIKTIEKVKKDYIYWSKFNYIMRNSTPEGVFVSSLEFEDKNMSTADDPSKKSSITDKNKLKLIGYAVTKNDVGIFWGCARKTKWIYSC